MIRSQLKKQLGDLITVGPSDAKKKWAERVSFAIFILGSLILFIYSWQQRSDPSFDEKGIIAGLGMAGAFGLLSLLVYFIILTVKLIQDGIRALIQFVIIRPAKSLGKHGTSFVMDSWIAKQVIKIVKRWLAGWEYIGFETSVKPFLSYLEPELSTRIIDVTELTQIHLDESHDNQVFIELVVDRYQRLATIMIVPLLFGYFIVLFLPGILALPIVRTWPILFLPFLILFFFVWIPSVIVGWRAYGNALVKRRDAWITRNWERLRQEQVNQIIQEASIQTETTLQARIDALRLAYQQELTRYGQLQQETRLVEDALQWFNRLSSEDQNSALWLFELQHNRIQEEIARRERSQLPKRTARDFIINVVAGLFGAFLTYVYGLFQ